MDWTGERMITQLRMGAGAAEHLHRYIFASSFCEGKTVLDIASGEGYGTNLLASVSAKVYGVDIDNNAIVEASRKYKKQNIQFLQGGVTSIPLAQECVDVIVSFETIEHLLEHEAMISEFRRVLRKDGLLIISTPAKEFYNKENKFHLKELTSSEFYELLGNFFKNVQFYHQKHIDSSFIYSVDERSNHPIQEFVGDFTHWDISKQNSYTYNLAVCTNADTDAPITKSSFFKSDHFTKSYYEFELDRLTKKIINTYEKSSSYKVGKALLSPFIFLKKRMAGK